MKSLCLFKAGPIHSEKYKWQWFPNACSTNLKWLNVKKNSHSWKTTSNYVVFHHWRFGHLRCDQSCIANRTERCTKLIKRRFENQSRYTDYWSDLCFNARRNSDFVIMLTECYIFTFWWFYTFGSIRMTIFAHKWIYCNK